MKIELTRSQMTNLCTNNYLEIEITDNNQDGPYIDQALYIVCNDIEVHGLITKIKEDNSKIVIVFDIVSEIKNEWLSLVRSLNKRDKQEANILVHMMLDRLCRNGEWEEVDKLIGMLKPETDDLDVLLSFLVVTNTTEAKRLLKNRARFYDYSEPRLRPKVWTVGVMDNLK